VLACACAAAPAIVPAGALLALAAGRGRRASVASLLLGLAAGLLLAPYLDEVLLGATRALQVAALLAGAGSLLLCERSAAAVMPLRLPAGGGMALLAAGGTLLAAARVLDVALDRGTLVGPALAGAVAIGAVAGLLLVRSRSTPLFVAAAALAAPLLL